VVLDLFDTEPARLGYLLEGLGQLFITHLERNYLSSVSAQRFVGRQAIHSLGTFVPGLHEQPLIRGDKGVLHILQQVGVVVKFLFCPLALGSVARVDC
jgi:hypothetical protein